MILSDHDILEIMTIFDESNFDELQIEDKELKLVLSKGSRDRRRRSAPLLSQEKLFESSVESRTTITRVTEEEERCTSSVGSTEAQARSTSANLPGLVGVTMVRAPLMGLFYRSPKPGAPPFVEVGTHVTEDTNVCIIEVMKLFTAVKAGAKGRIIKICAENSQLVEYGQALFQIDPSAES
jgi:acetyl-CoA carboxylase biotin carboxyl carrier protein